MQQLSKTSAAHSAFNRAATPAWPVHPTVLLKAYRKTLRDLGYSRVAVLRSSTEQRAFCPHCATLEPPVISAVRCQVTADGFEFVCSACPTLTLVRKPIHNWSLERRRLAEREKLPESA
jgi:hypothetical protein